MNPSNNRLASFCWQIRHETKFVPSLTRLPSPPTMNSLILLRSGLHRDRRSGRGFPKSSFIPCVIRKAEAKAKASPIQAVFHSHSLRCQIRLLGVAFDTVGPGTRVREITSVITAGARRPTRTRVAVLIVSFTVKGNEISGSLRSKARWLGVMRLNRAPTTANKLQIVVRK